VRLPSVGTVDADLLLVRYATSSSSARDVALCDVEGVGDIAAPCAEIVAIVGDL